MLDRTWLLCEDEPERVGDQVRPKRSFGSSSVTGCSTSGMAALAEAGFDSVAMDLTGYDLSAHLPKMNALCNASPEQQPLLMPSPLQAMCPPSYPRTGC